MSADKNSASTKEAVGSPGTDCRDHHEALIDEAVEESFPASDPPSIARPACLDEAGKDGKD